MNQNYQKFLELLIKNNLSNNAQINSNSEHYFIELYQQLLKFATNQLNDQALAEDVVQLSLIDAIQYYRNFKGNSAFKTWVFSILKNKIIDHIRQNKNYVVMSELSDDEFETIDLLFSKNGHWQSNYTPTAFDNSFYDPELQVENKHFWQILEYCLEHLSAEQSRVFLMKEYIGLDSDEICQSLNISRENYYVLIYRARLNLQNCLSRHWFNV